MNESAKIISKPEEKIVPKVILSGQEQRVASLVETASKEPPVIEGVNELGTRLLMQIPPKILKARPEWAYKWGSIAELDRNLSKNGGAWEVVTRNNHSHIDSGLFDATGAIGYRGQNILLFSRRDYQESVENKITKDFNMMVEDEVTNRNPKQYGKGSVVVEQLDSSVGGGGMPLDESEPDFDSPTNH